MEWEGIGEYRMSLPLILSLISLFFIINLSIIKKVLTYKRFFG